LGSGEYAFLLTFGINLAGCFWLTFILTLIVRGAKIGEKARLFLTTGFLGAFTTFSTFSLELFNLWRAGNPFLALLYALASVAGGILAAWLGFSTARLIIRKA
jgi:CrcB protein